MTVARAVWGFIDHRDRNFMRRVHRWRPPRIVRLWMILATRLGDGWVWYGLAAVFFFTGGRERFLALAAGAVAAAAGIVVFCVVKRASHRQRPCEIEPHCWARIQPPDEFSFPSGHSITAFAIAIAIGHFYAGLEMPLLALALSIAASRVILGMHFVSDVVVGSLMGVLLGWTSAQVFG
jgi:undecaprenyl-diphosphatase